MFQTSRIKAASGRPFCLHRIESKPCDLRSLQPGILPIRVAYLNDFLGIRVEKMIRYAALLAFAMFAACFSANAQELLQDGQQVNLDFTSGPASKIKGSRGMGKFRQGLNNAKSRFGPAKILQHTTSELQFETRTEICRLKANRTITCSQGSKGTWN